MRLIFVGCLAVGLVGCAHGWSASDEMAVEAKAAVGLTDCQKSAKTNVEMAVCSNNVLIQTYVAAKYPYPDLIQAFATVNFDIAQDLDAGKITRDQGAQRLSTAFAKVEEIQASRLAADQMRRTEAALMFYKMGQDISQAYKPPSQLHCVTHYVGDQAYTDCQ